MPDDPVPVQRTAAYAVVHDTAGALLLVRGSERSDHPGRWGLPGGDLGHGEDPADAVTREVAASAGLDVRVTAPPRAVLADVADLPHRGVRVHTLRLLYDAAPAPGAPLDGSLRPQPGAGSDRVALVPPDRVAELPLVPYVGELLGLDVAAGAPAPDGLGPSPGVPPEADRDAEVDEAVAADVVVRMQRPGAYAVVRDGDRVLLTRLRDTGGMWTLPGGGIDHGEDPLVAVVREVYEETGLDLTPGRLVAVTSRHFTGHAPNGRLEDFHAIRLLYDGTVGPGEPHVTEVGGSTDAVAWHPLAGLEHLALASVVHEGLAAIGVASVRRG